VVGFSSYAALRDGSAVTVISRLELHRGYNPAGSQEILCSRSQMACLAGKVRTMTLALARI
jgi:hypothetical protein